MTLRQCSTNHACGMVVWTPIFGELSLKDEEKKMLGEKKQTKKIACRKQKGMKIYRWNQCVHAGSKLQRL